MELIKLAFYSACFSAFIDFCFNVGNLLEWYYKLLQKIDHLMISKPLGLCIYCMGSWVFIAFYLCEISQSSVSINNLIGLFSGLGLNFIFLKIYDKYL